jgi:hypothetical protein
MYEAAGKTVQSPFVYGEFAYTYCLQVSRNKNALETEKVARAHEYWGG